MIFMNPIFGRRNIPSMVKVGLSLGIALSAYSGMQEISIVDYTGIDLLISTMKEFLIGFALGFIIQLFLSIFQLGGELIDMQMGIGMAMIYDPSSNSQISITGNIMTIMYTLLFFITNSHIALIHITVRSFQVIPIGLERFNGKVAIYLIELFGYILVYAVQLALPVIVTEILVEVAVGILMRFVPNINVFVVNLQIKLLVGFTVIITIIPVLVKYMGKLNMVMLERLQEVLLYIS
jgi:flagellar biosynthetic protein FliR